MKHELVRDAWVEASKAIERIMGDEFNKENYGLIVAVALSAHITEFGTATPEEAEANADAMVDCIKEILAHEDFNQTVH